MGGFSFRGLVGIILCTTSRNGKAVRAVCMLVDTVLYFFSGLLEFVYHRLQDGHCSDHCKRTTSMGRTNYISRNRTFYSPLNKPKLASDSKMQDRADLRNLVLT